MDAAEQVYDERTRRGVLRDLIPGEEPVREEHASAGAGIRLDHVEDRLAELTRLLRAERREDAVVDRVVEEEHLRGLDDDGDERQQAVLYEHLRTRLEHREDRRHDRTRDVEAKDGEDEAEDADGEIVHEHLEARLDLPLDQGVKLLDDPARERPHDHGTHEHRRARIRLDDAHDRNRPHDRAARPADHLAARVGDEERQRIPEERADERTEFLVRQPARVDEERRCQPPGDEGADVGHDHARQELSERLNLLFHNASPCDFMCEIPSYKTQFPQIFIIAFSCC